MLICSWYTSPLTRTTNSNINVKEALWNMAKGLLPHDNKYNIYNTPLV